MPRKPAKQTKQRKQTKRTERKPRAKKADNTVHEIRANFGPETTVRTFGEAARFLNDLAFYGHQPTLDQEEKDLVAALVASGRADMKAQMLDYCTDNGILPESCKAALMSLEKETDGIALVNDETPGDGEMHPAQ